MMRFPADDCDELPLLETFGFGACITTEVSANAFCYFIR
jgi:hypothetical protein